MPEAPGEVGGADDVYAVIGAAASSARRWAPRRAGRSWPASSLCNPPSLGFGDVRLSALNGLLCGWWGWPVALAGLTAGFVLALPEALVTLARHGLRTSRPLGPYLLAGAAAAAGWAAATRGLVAD